MEYAATLGMIDIGFIPPEKAACDYRGNWGTDDLEYLSRYDGLLYFRINSLGSYALGISNSFVTEVKVVNAFFNVLPNYDIVLTDTASANKSDTLYLNKIAEKQSDFLWKLTQKSIHSAIELGEELKTIKEFLSTKSINGIPSTVETLLNDSTTRVLEFKYEGRACFLMCDDPWVINQIKLDSKLKKCALVCEPSTIIIRIGLENEFFKRLKELNYAVPIASKII